MTDTRFADHEMSSRAQSRDGMTSPLLRGDSGVCFLKATRKPRSQIAATPVCPSHQSVKQSVPHLRLEHKHTKPIPDSANGELEFIVAKQYPVSILLLHTATVINGGGRI